MRSGARSWLTGALLALPLVLLSAWLVHRALHPAAPLATPSAAPAPPSAGGIARDLPPRLDLSADRLEERVDGAADALRAAGCVRLLYWRSEAPPADVEALVFDTVAHAHAALDREAGPVRTPGPGDEAQASEQAVYVRKGAAVVRAFADPGVADGAALLALAGRIEPTLAGLR